MTRRFAQACLILVGISTLAAATGTSSPAASTASAGTASSARALPARPMPASAFHRLDQREFTAAPDSGQCETAFHVACYSPPQLQHAYGVDELIELGITGAGATVAIVTPFGSPTIEHDLQVFDHTWGLPDPPSIRTIAPVGTMPAFDPADDEMVAWAFESTLDVEYAHVMAPLANIVVVATPIAETEGVVGFPEIVAAENYVIDHGLADVISQSLGTAEQTFPDPQRLLELRGAFVNAEQHGVSILAGAGDSGATDYESDEQTLYSYPVQSWPSSDPLVTSVGGTRLDLDASGNRRAPDTTWNDDYGAGGGGLSSVFARPSYQDSVRGEVGDRRGTPDVSLSAAVDGGAIVYTSYDPDDVGWGVVGGTSEAAPLFAGIVALAVQQAGHRLGLLNPVLYRLAGAPDSGLVDVTTGDNSYGDVVGFQAGAGYDMASGLGTVDAARLVPALAGAAGG